MTPESVIEATGISRVFGDRTVLREASVRVRRGEPLCITGPSGSGKTTLLRTLNLLTLPTAGELRFCGELVGKWPAPGVAPGYDLNQYRSQIGMVFQHFELFPHLTALGNVTLGLKLVKRQSKEERRIHGLDMLRRVGLEEYADAHPRSLSGGQKQRVAIARALAMEPKAILFDEPTSALDESMAEEVTDLISSLAREGRTMVIVTHQLSFARAVADRLIVMDAGRIVEEGPTEAIFTRPAYERTREILRLTRLQASTPSNYPAPSVSSERHG